VSVLDSENSITEDSILIIRFVGEYPGGAPGNPVAEWMCLGAGSLVNKHLPSALILDLRELAYDWGDMIERVYSIGHEAAPQILQATVVSDTNRRALSTLEWGPKTTRDITELDDVFDDIDDAISYVRIRRNSI
jgi:hypothetical protein